MGTLPPALFLLQAIFQPDIPLTWTDKAIAALEVPLADPRHSPARIDEKTAGSLNAFRGRPFES